jgi:hypothetical protein
MDQPHDVDFFFDPLCPWTWMTSRWLIDAAGQRGVTITWRSLSLPVVNEGKEIPDRFRSAMEVSRRAHRVFAALDADGRNDLVAALYTELGRRLHHDAVDRRPEVVTEAAEASGAGRWAGAADDESLDAAVEASTKEAVDLAGPDVGSPVLAVGTPRRAMFGPIVNPPPSGPAAGELFDAVVALIPVDHFLELKRGRRQGPQFGPRP